MTTKSELLSKRKEIEIACKDENACTSEYNLLLQADDIEFLQILMRNFSWCVNNNILLETDIPVDFEEMIKLNCSGCDNLMTIGDYPNLQRLSCSYCDDLTTIGDYPNLQA